MLIDRDGTERFYPFNIMHPVWELRCGALRIFEKYRKRFPGAGLLFQCEKNRLYSFMQRFGISEAPARKGNVLALDSRFIPNSLLASEIDNFAVVFPRGFNAKLGDHIIATFYPEELAVQEHYTLDNPDFPSCNFSSKTGIFLENLWDAVYHNEDEILNDRELFADYFLPSSEINKYSYAINHENIRMGQGVRISPNVVLDASGGPIIIGKGVHIMPQATIIGPCYIGDNTVIKIGAKIYEKTSIGEFCKVGGEVENSIIQAYSNKQHEGFLGHSFLGEWVNLGADTNTSDLKNTYSEIKLRIRDKEFETGKIFLGLLCGDHTKSAINTQFTTGTVAGVCGILVREGFLPNFIPSFSWGGRADSPTYKLSKAIETAQIVMKRRNRQLSGFEIALLKEEHENVSAR